MIVLGLDGATWRNLEPWIEQYDLPNLATLIDSGIKGTLQSTIPSNTIPAVPALTTGKNPASLGLFDFTQPDGSVIDAQDIEDPAIWDAIGTKQRSLIANLRSTYPPYNISGTMIAGDLFLPSGANDYVTPISRYDDLRDFHDDERRSRWNKLARSPNKNAGELLNLACEDVRQKYDQFKQLWQQNEYDFGLFWIGKTDTIQHLFWHKPNRIRLFYEFVDSIIGDILENIDPNNLTILSDHGFGQVPERRFHVNTWLYSKGYVSARGGRAQTITLGIGQELLLKYIPKSILQKISTVIYDTDRDKNELNMDDNNVLEPLFDTNPVVVKKQASVATLTHPWGITVPSGDDNIIEDIVKNIREIEDDRGNQVVQDAWCRNEVFEGSYLNQVPDVIFLTSERYQASPVFSRSLFTRCNRGDVNSPQRTIGEHPVTGEHNTMRDGIGVFYGPDFASVNNVSVDITDIAPTLIHMLKHAVPKSMDGDVRTDLLVTDRPTEYTELSGSRDTKKYQSNDKEDEIRQRLQNLGYLER